MNAIIFTEGGGDKGYGHLSRCIAIYDSLKEFNIETELVVNGTEEVCTLLMDRNFFFCNWPNNFRDNGGNFHDADLLIFDSYTAEKKLYDNIAASTEGLCVFLDDDNRMEYPNGVVINPINAAYNLGYSKKKDDLFLGYKYFPFRKEFWYPRKIKHPDLIGNVLLVLGGSDIRGLSLPLIEFITHLLPDITLNVIITASYKNSDAFNNIINEGVSIHENPSTDNLVSLMLNADVAVTGAGQTMFELAALGVPMIAIGIIENQKYNIESLENDGCILFAGYWDDNRLYKNLKAAFEVIADRGERERISQKSSHLLNAKGALSISKKLVDNLDRKFLLIRKVELEDAEGLFELSNDSTVRQNSINHKKIGWQQHVQWLRSKIIDPNCRFFVITDKSETLVGQVRYDLSGERTAIVSISISPSFRGRGFASYILIESSRILFKEDNSLELVKAYIRPENEGSIISFTKAGYKQYLKEKINDEDFEVFLLKR